MAEVPPGEPGSGSPDDRPGQQPPPGPTPPQPYGYAQPGYGYPPAPQTDGMATAALVTAIVGFFVCLPVGAIAALVMANSAERRIEASGGRLTGLEQARVARIIAIAELVLVAVVVVVGILIALVAVNTSSSAVITAPAS
jgi:hypothetical protein